ncbi:cache domain-containing sensor histidine kinase [Actinomyces urogenitalis]|nr:sensor histidine kinase [Actinomyces urogenitalis]
MRRFLQSIHGRMLLALTAVGLVPVLVLGMVCYAVAVNALDRRTAAYSHDILEQAAINLDGRADQIEATSFTIAMHDVVQDGLLTASTAGSESYDPIELEEHVSSQISAAILYEDAIVWASLIDVTAEHTFQVKKQVRNTDVSASMIAAAEEGDGGAIWAQDPQDPQTVLMLREVKSVKTLQTLGYLVLGIRQSVFARTLGNTQLMLGGSVVIVDSNGLVLSSPDTDSLRSRPDIATQALRGEPGDFSVVNVDGVRQYVAVGPELATGWRPVMTVPVSVYLRDVSVVRWTIMGTMATLLMVGVILAWVMSTRMARPIRVLARDLRRFGNGELSRRSRLVRSDEIGELATAFNGLADNVVALLKQTQEDERTKRDYEMRMLRMQINPHFLYNTLETINWMGQRHGADDVVEVSTSLGSLLRSTIDAPSLVFLKQELESLRHYARIQHYRFGDGVEIREEIDPDSLACRIPPFTLQPLVENALVHGIAPMGGQGLVMISARLDGAYLVLSVSDDGAGMSPERCGEILARSRQPDEQEHGSIGLANVIRRVRGFYPQAPQIRLTSEIGEGTTVTIWVPADSDSESTAHTTSQGESQ